MASENLSDEEYLDSLLEKVSSDTDEKKSGKKTDAAPMSSIDMEDEADRAVQRMLQQGFNEYKNPAFHDISMEGLKEREKQIAEGTIKGDLLGNPDSDDQDLMASLDSIVQEIKGDSSGEEPAEETPAKRPKRKIFKREIPEETEEPKKAKKSKGSFSDKLKNVFFKVEMVDLDKEEQDEQQKKEKKKQAKARKAEEQAQAKAAKAEEKKTADAAKKEKAQAKKAEKAKLLEEKKAKKAEKKANREPEERVKLKPAFVLFLASVIAVMTLSIRLLSDNYAYDNAMSTAQRKFVNKRYEEAYEALAGVKIKESDQMFYEQVRLVMRLERQYDAYVNYSHLEMPKEALHALLQGMTIYYESTDYMEAYNLVDQMEEQKETLLYSLSNDFGIDEERARQICGLENTNDYTREVELYSAHYLLQ